MFTRILSTLIAIIVILSGMIFGPRNEIKKYRDLPYGTDMERQILDLNIPTSVKGDANMILYIHGGAWTSGSKDSYEETLNILSERGFVCAAINYRYCGKPNNATVYDVMDDITAALSLIKTTAKSVGVNLNGVILSGGSAGAHLSLLYGYSQVETAPIKPVAVIALAPVSDLTDMTIYDGSLHKLDPEKWCIPKKEWVKYLSVMTGQRINFLNLKFKKDALYDISPMKYVSEDSVPTIIAHGTMDTVLPYNNSVALDAKLTKCGVDHEFITFNGAWHSLADCPEGQEALNEATEKYYQRFLEN
ncbi:MAG: alpha/beta hydrolase [Ruminococcus sp.]|nr:alpha/beta hydrolase [Candidatus Copronaster equi]